MLLHCGSGTDGVVMVAGMMVWYYGDGEIAMW